MVFLVSGVSNDDRYSFCQFFDKREKAESFLDKMEDQYDRVGTSVYGGQISEVSEEEAKEKVSQYYEDMFDSND